MKYVVNTSLFEHVCRTRSYCTSIFTIL